MLAHAAVTVQLRIDVAGRVRRTALDSVWGIRHRPGPVVSRQAPFAGVSEIEGPREQLEAIR